MALTCKGLLATLKGFDNAKQSGLQQYPWKSPLCKASTAANTQLAQGRGDHPV